METEAAAAAAVVAVAARGVVHGTPANLGHISMCVSGRLGGEVRGTGEPLEETSWNNVVEHRRTSVTGELVLP